MVSLCNRTGAPELRVLLDRIRVENALSQGIIISSSDTGSTIAMVRDSVSAGNAGAGLAAGGTADVMISRSAVVNNSHGVIAYDIAGTTIRIGKSTVNGNSNFGFFPGIGSIISYGNNAVNGNGTDGAPTSTIPMK